MTEAEIEEADARRRAREEAEEFAADAMFVQIERRLAERRGLLLELQDIKYDPHNMADDLRRRAKKISVDLCYLMTAFCRPGIEEVVRQEIEKQKEKERLRTC